MNKTPLELLVRILVNGGRVKENGFEYAMSEDGSLCQVDEFGMGHVVECDLRGLKSMADSIGRDDLWLLCCELVLKN